MADLLWLSDEQWAVLEPFMPQNRPGARRVTSGIVHVLKTGGYCATARMHTGRTHDARRYRDRWCIGAAFCRLKDFRRVATRYDKLAVNFASAVALAAVIAFWC